MVRALGAGLWGLGGGLPWGLPWRIVGRGRNSEPTGAAAGWWCEELAVVGWGLARLEGERMTGRGSLRDFVLCLREDGVFSACIGQGAGRRGTMACQLWSWTSPV